MDPSIYHKILEIPNDASVDTIEEAYRRLVAKSENGKFNLNSKQTIDKLTKIRDYLVNQRKDVGQQEQQQQLSHKAKCFVPQNKSPTQPENLMSYENDFFQNVPSECFKILRISEDFSIEDIEQIRQNYIAKEQEFIEKNYTRSVKFYQDRIQMCEVLIKHQSKNKKLENKFFKIFDQDSNTDLELNPIEQDPLECFKNINLPENSPIENIQKERQYFVQNVNQCLEQNHKHTAKFFQGKIKSCDYLIHLKTEQMNLENKQNSILNLEFQSELTKNYHEDLSAKYFKLLEIPDNSPIEAAEKAYQRLLNESDFPWEQNFDSIDKANKLSEAYEYLKNCYFQNKENENQMEIDQQGEISLVTQHSEHTFPELQTDETQTNNDIPMDYYSNGRETVDVQKDESDYNVFFKHKICFDNFGDQTNANEPITNETVGVIESDVKEMAEGKLCGNNSINKESNNEDLTNNDTETNVPIKKDLFLSLEEIFRGLNQKVILRWMNEDKYINDETIRIKINHGILPDTEIPCSAKNSIQKDQTEFILVIKDKPNQKFKRLNEVDIEYTAYITKEESINGCELSIPTLENDPITMTFEDEITEDTEEVFTDRGLPLAGNKKERGKLVVKFKIADNPNDRTSHVQSYSKEKVVIEKQISKAEKQRIAEKAKNELQNKPENKPSEQIKEKQSFASPKVENNAFIDSNANQTDQNNQSDERDEGYVIIDINEAPDSYVEHENKDIPQNQQQKPQELLPPNEIDLPLTLEEIFCGGVKSVQITTKRTDKQGVEHQDNKTFNIDINSELKNGDKITFEHEGDMCYGKIPADVIFTVCQKPNSIFKRIGCDLEYVAKITQKEAILGGELIIPPLNGNKPIKWKFEGGITIGTRLHISRNELPVSSANNKRGNLIVIFEILDMQEEETEQDESIEHDVNITLEQIFNGCNKRVKITRNIIDVDGNERAEEKILTMDIKPGTTSGTAFTFPREGDQYPGCIPADIVFVVQDKPNDVFRRIGSDIEHIVTLTKSEFNNGGKIVIPTLDGKPKELSLDGIINEKTARKFANCGLPIPENPTRRGNLLVKFKIVEDPQDEPILNNLELSLEEILTGCVKQLSITRKVFDYNGNQLSSKEEPIKIVVEKGTFEGQEFVFEKHGDKKPGKTPADVIFVVRYKEHPQFKDKGHDLYYTARITESEAKNGVRLEIPTLESGQFVFAKKGIKPDDVIPYTGLGLPYPGGNNKRGDLILRFNIVEDSLKDLPIEKKLNFSLEQLSRGCEKKMNITRTIVDSEGIETTEQKTITLTIPPGIESGQKFFKRRVGDHLNPNRIPGDIIFTICELKHVQFSRKGNDLEFIASITESEAKHGCDLQIPTIYGDHRNLTIPKKLNPDLIKTFKNAGMPFLQQPNKRGDLIVRFDIIQDPAHHNKKSTDSKNKNNNKMSEESKQNSNKKKFSDQLKNDEPVEYEIPVSLEDILSGCTKRMRIKRIVNDSEGNEFQENEILTLEIEPGTETGTKFTFEKAKYPKISADITFEMVEEKHNLFTRIGPNLQYTAQITEDQSQGCELSIPTLEGEPVALKIYSSLSPKETRKIPFRGLPHFNNTSKRGNIIVNFKIVKSLKNANNGNSNKTYKAEYSNQNQEMPQDPPIFINTYYLLEQILSGYKETFSLPFRHTSEDGAVNYANRNFEIYLQPGEKNGAEFVFPRQGEIKPGIVPADVIFVATLIRHRHFRRLGRDIVYRAKVTQKIAVEGGNIDVPTLEGTMLSVPINGPLDPDKPKEIVNRGLPYVDNSTKRGRLIIQFEIIQDEGITIKKIFGKVKEKYHEYTS